MCKMLCPVCLELYSDISNLNVYNTRNRRNSNDIDSLLFCQLVSVPVFICIQFIPAFFSVSVLFVFLYFVL